METLKEAKEDDLRKAGLKMGDIIKLRRVLARDEALNSSLSSCSGSEPEFMDTTPSTSAKSPNPAAKQVGFFPQ